MTNVELVSIAPEKIAAVGRPLPAVARPARSSTTPRSARWRASRPSGTGAPTSRPCAARPQAVLEAGCLSLVVAHFPLGCVAVTRDGQLRSRPSVNVPTEAMRGHERGRGRLHGRHPLRPAGGLEPGGHADAGARLGRGEPARALHRRLRRALARGAGARAAMGLEARFDLAEAQPETAAFCDGTMLQRRRCSVGRASAMPCSASLTHAES